jgi:DNA-binding NarL/FixJ family response regulator
VATRTDIKVMIAHEVPLVRAGLEVALQGEYDLEIVSAAGLLGRMSAASGQTQPQGMKIVIADRATGPQLAMAGRSSGYCVLIVTSDDTETGIVRAVEAGVRGYLLLTSSLEAVVGAVRSLAYGGTALDPIVATRMIDSLTFDSLTNREGEVLRLLMLGLGDKAIANRLGRSVGTVKSHVKALLFKLNARCRTEAVAVAQRRGFVSAEPAQPVRAAGSAASGFSVVQATREASPCRAGARFEGALAVSILPGRHSVLLAERAGEVRGAVESTGERDLRDRLASP